MTDNLVPEPQSSVFDAAVRALGDEDAARRVMTNPALARFPGGRPPAAPDGPDGTADADPEAGTAPDGAGRDDACGCGGRKDSCACSDGEDGDIPLTFVDDIGRATAADVREALHQVIDPELGIDVIDLGLVYGIEIDDKGRAIITMTLTTPACPLTDLIEDECASTLAGLVEEFRIDWTWQPRWTTDRITPEGRDQLAALGFNLDNMPRY